VIKHLDDSCVDIPSYHCFSVCELLHVFIGGGGGGMGVEFQVLSFEIVSSSFLMLPALWSCTETFSPHSIAPLPSEVLSMLLKSHIFVKLLKCFAFLEYSSSLNSNYCVKTLFLPKN
jgi:hypothetical protein